MMSDYKFLRIAFWVVTIFAIIWTATLIIATLTTL
jgi:hypothetical protein